MPVYRRENEEECEVNGAFLLTIRLQRWIGLAPVHIRKRGSQYFISRCRFYTYLGYLFSIIHCVLLLVATFWDISTKDTSRTVNFGTPSRGALWSMNIINALVTYIFGCFGAEKRMIHLMSYLNEVKQIKLLLKDEKDQWNVIKQVLFIFNYLSLITFILLHCYITLINIGNRETDMTIFHLYHLEYTHYLLMFLTGILYKNTIQLFNATLHLINGQFEDILSDVKNNLSKITEEANARENPPLRFSTKSVNRAIEQLGVTELKRPASALSEEKEEKLHQLLRQQDRVCVLIGRFNKRDGILILSVVFTCITCILSLSYNVISTLYDAEIDYFWIIYYCHLLFWLLWFIINTMTIVKACQQTTSEITAMKRLVSYFMSHIAKDNDPLYNVLDTYYHRLRLHNVGYSPFGLFQLNEHLIFTLMSAVSTYCFIFMDFHIDAGFIRKRI